MASIFSGTPQTATSYATSTSESPKWLQDAIYTQVQLASNLAAQPYTAYTGTLAAGLTPQQQAAYKAVSDNQAAWKPSFDTAQTGTEKLASAPGGLSAAQSYFNKGIETSGIGAAQPYLNKAIDASGVEAAQPYLKQESSTLGGLNTQAGVNALSPYVTQAVKTSGMAAANPYLQNAAQTSASDINQFMNPYTQNVTDQIAKLGARNLTENLLPGVSDAFIKAGQFGGTRMGEFGSRALRDTQESILNQQSQALQSGYGQALGAAQQEAARQAQLATTAGALTNAQQQALLQSGQALSSAEQQAQQQALAKAQQYGVMGQQAGALTQAQQQALLAAGQQAGNLTNAQQQALLSTGQQAGALTQADLARQQSALQQLASMSQQGQQMRTTDTAALEAAGSAQQQQAQKEADAAYQQWQNAQLYPRQMADWLSTQVRGMAPITPQTTTNAGSSTGQTYSASPLSQLASAGATGAGLYKLATGG